MERLFISYNKADAAWAEWVAWIFHDIGYQVTLQAWNFRPGHNFVHEMNLALTQSDQCILVLSPESLTSDFVSAEWAAAFARDPTGKGRKLIPVRVRDCTPDGLLGQIVHIDLVGLDEKSAEQRLVDGLRDPRPPSARPSFPGMGGSSERVSGPRPAFPDGGGSAPTPPDFAGASGTDRFGRWMAFSVVDSRGVEVTQRMRWIPSGKFLMGSPEDEPTRSDNEGPQHEVTISQGFWLGDTACTQADRVPRRGVTGAAASWSPADLAGLIRPPERAA
jgi:hypothetical protein